MDVMDVMEIIKTCIYFGIFLLAVLSAYTAYKHLKLADNQEKLKGISSLFETFNASEARDSRRWIYHNYYYLITPEIIPLLEKDIDILNLLENLCNSLDLSASFILNKWIDMGDAIYIYGDSILRCWVILRPWIKRQRKFRRQELSLWKKIEELADKVIEEGDYKDWAENGVRIYTETKPILLDYGNSEIIPEKEKI